MKKYLFSWSCLLLAIALFTAVAFSAFAAREDVYVSAAAGMPPLSGGLRILAAELGMNKSGLAGEELVFDAEDFARAMNLSSVTSVTVTSLPPVTDGELRLGAVRVHEGQTVSRGDLDRLAFVSAGTSVSHSFFTFRVGESGHDIRCEIHLLRERNAAPVIADSMPVRGICKHMSHQGQIAVTDPEGDSIRCVLVEAPVNGSLIWLDAARGIYLYRPAAGFAGEDSFSVIAVDRWGNTSAQTKVTVRVGICAVEK